MKIRRVVVKIFQEQTKRIHSQIDEVKETAYTFSYPETKMDFMVSQTETDQPDGCFVKIYGVSKETYALFSSVKNKKIDDTQKIEVHYGYDSELSLVFSGTIDRATYSFSDGAQILTLLISKNARKFVNVKKPISTNESQTIKSALEIIGKEYGYTVRFGSGDTFGSVSIGRFCHTGTVKSALKSVLPAEYGYYINENEIYVYHKDNSTPREITIWSQNGLLAYPTEDSKQEKTTIKTILIPNVESGMKINIPVDDIWFSPINTGKYRTYVVGNYVSSFQGGIGTTEFECEGGATGGNS